MSWQRNRRRQAKSPALLSGTLAAIGHTFVAIVIGLYLAADPRPYIEGTVRLFPPAHRKRAREVLLAMGHTLRWWLFGKAISMVASRDCGLHRVGSASECRWRARWR